MKSNGFWPIASIVVSTVVLLSIFQNCGQFAPIEFQEAQSVNTVDDNNVPNVPPPPPEQELALATSFTKVYDDIDTSDVFAIAEIPNNGVVVVGGVKMPTDVTL